jgi:hypothetical protein
MVVESTEVESKILEMKMEGKYFRHVAFEVMVVCLITPN